MSQAPSQIYRYDITVPAAAIDDNNHLNNVTYVQWMQTVAIAQSDAAGSGDCLCGSCCGQ